MKKKLVKITYSLLLGALITLVGCKKDPPSSSTTTDPTKPAVKIKIPKFNRDSAFVYVEKQVAFGPRVVNTPEHKACKNWLVKKFESHGTTVIEQNFDATAYTGEVLKSTNIIAQYKPKQKKRILLAAHWDTRHIADSPLCEERCKEPILGADDGGSGVGVLLEIARTLQANPIDMGVDFVLFDAEDYGDGGDNGESTSWCLGSQYWSKNLHVRGYRPKYGILLDMVGTKDARFAKEQVSMAFAPKVMNKVWKLAKNMGYGNYFVPESSNPVTDDHLFVNQIAKIPMIDIINKPVQTQTGFGAHWHTHNDNMDIINKRTLRAVGQTVTAAIYKEAEGSF